MSIELILTGLITLIGGILVNGVSWMLWKNQRAKLEAEGKKLHAETSHIVTETALTMVQELKATVKEQGEQITQLTERVEILENENRVLQQGKECFRRGALILEKQLIDLQEVPRWYVPLEVEGK